MILARKVLKKKNNKYHIYLYWFSFAAVTDHPKFSGTDKWDRLIHLAPLSVEVHLLCFRFCKVNIKGSAALSIFLWGWLTLKFFWFIGHTQILSVTGLHFLGDSHPGVPWEVDSGLAHRTPSHPYAQHTAPFSHRQKPLPMQICNIHCEQIS